MSEVRATLIPNFLRASSPQGLRRAMLSNNARLGAMVQYFSIQQVVEKQRTYWIAWYYEDVQQNSASILRGDDGDSA